MADVDDLHAAIARRRLPADVLIANGISAADAETFQRQVERHEVNPAIPASIVTLLGASVAANLTRGARVATSGR